MSYRLETAMDQLAVNFQQITVANGYRTDLPAAHIHKVLRTLDTFDPEDTPAVMLGFKEVREEESGGDSAGRLITARGELLAWGVTYDKTAPSGKAIDLAWDIGRNVRENTHIGNLAGGGFIAHSSTVQSIRSLSGEFNPGIEGVFHPYEMTRVEIEVLWRYPHLTP